WGNALGAERGVIDQANDPNMMNWMNKFAPENLGKAGGMYDKAASYLDPIASGSMIGQDNPYLNDILSTIDSRTRNDVGGQFAAAGRSFSGAHANALGAGMAAGEAQPLFSNYWNERNAQQNAIQGLGQIGQGYGALGEDF